MGREWPPEIEKFRRRLCAARACSTSTSALRLWASTPGGGGAGSRAPKVPHLVKQRTLTEFAQNYKLEVLVETGTNLGHMIGVQKDRFREIYSIELDEWLAARAKRKFADRPHIHLFQGDSGTVLPK